MTTMFPTVRVSLIPIICSMKQFVTFGLEIYPAVRAFFYKISYYGHLFAKGYTLNTYITVLGKEADIKLGSKDIYLKISICRSF